VINPDAIKVLRHSNRSVTLASSREGCGNPYLWHYLRRV